MAIRRPRYTFLQDESAPHFRAALVLSGVSLAVLCVLVVVSAAAAGGIGMTGGAAALAAMLTAWYAFAVSMRELVRRPVCVRLAVLGTVSSGVLSIVWLALLLSGVKQI